MNFYLFCLVGLLFGIGFGIFVQRSGFCIAHGLGEIFTGRGRRFVRLFLVIFIITSLGFLFSPQLHRLLGLGGDPAGLGLKPIGQLRGLGFYNLLSGILFGAGIMLNGGCILGTLRQLGEGNLDFLVVLLAFIPGMALIVYGFNPLVAEVDQVAKPLLPDLFGVPARYMTGILVVLALFWYLTVRRRRSPVLVPARESASVPTR